MFSTFNLCSDFKPSLDQQKAIDSLSKGISNKENSLLLIGVTGSGKTFTMANIIKNSNRPTLIMTHNKTLTAQLYSEFKEFFPNNAVEYFVSYYDYYQPEAYVPTKDLYIEKDTSINDDLDKLRLSATRSLFEREDVIIVSSVSCIYGLGSPQAYSGMMFYMIIDQEITRKQIVSRLTEIQYKRNDLDFSRGNFRMRGDRIDIYLAYEDIGVRIELLDDTIETITKIDVLTSKTISTHTKIAIYPASHYVTPKSMIPKTLELISQELDLSIKNFKFQSKLVEAQRIKQRTEYDIEMLEETGSCSGVENYSRIMNRRQAGEPPPTLIDYFPSQSLLFLDESHVSLPQIRGMYYGDYSRKKNLVDYGFRLPSALDNRPLKYEEFNKIIKQRIYVSATPNNYELENSTTKAEQIIRPTGLLDPKIEIQPTMGQVDYMYSEILKTTANKQRILVITLTKKMAENLCDYYKQLRLKVCYIHSDINTIERSVILKNLRMGEIDVLVGINLLREGLDLPEVALIGIFDADKEGFLRSKTSLLQTCGRAARNSNGRVIMFANSITKSMQDTIDETNKRRAIQLKHNQKYNITPTTITKKIHQALVEKNKDLPAAKKFTYNNQNLKKKIIDLKNAMQKSAKQLDFEQAAKLRDEMQHLKNVDLGLSK